MEAHCFFYFRPSGTPLWLSVWFTGHLDLEPEETMFGSEGGAGEGVRGRWNFWPQSMQHVNQIETENKKTGNTFEGFIYIINYGNIFRYTRSCVRMMSFNCWRCCDSRKSFYWMSVSRLKMKECELEAAPRITCEVASALLHFPACLSLMYCLWFRQICNNSALAGLNKRQIRI